MLVKLSGPLKQHIETTVRLRAGQSRVLDVFGVAEEIRARFSDDNVALEDIAAMVARLGAQSGCALELDAGPDSPGATVVYSS
jgi:hypothetical protein